MAITIIKQKTANSFHSSANPITLTLDSSNTGKCNFRYINDIYINGVKVFTHKLFPDPITGYGFFQIDRICSDWIEGQIQKTWPANAFNSVGSTTAPSSVISVQCKFGEEYDGSTYCNGTVLQYPNLATSTTFYVFHGAFNYEDWLTTSTSNYTITFASQSQTAKFLTNAPRRLQIGFNEPYYLDIMGVSAPPAYVATGFVAVRYRVYYKDNTVDALWRAAGPQTNTKRWRVHAGSYDINKLATKTMISDAANSYDVTVVWASFDPLRDPEYVAHATLSETFTFDVKDTSPYRTRFTFLGNLGSMDAITFHHRNVKTYDIEKKVYNKGLLRNYASDWTYQVGDRGVDTAWSRTTQRHRVGTFVNKEESLWLNELYYSPEVYKYKLEPQFKFHTLPSVVYDPTTTLDIWVDEDHDIVAGNYIFMFPKWESDNEIKQPIKLYVNSVGGRRVSCASLTYTTAKTYYTGCIQKDASWKVLPIVIQDTSVEEKQKTGRPIQYDITYTTSYPKITIK